MKQHDKSSAGNGNAAKPKTAEKPAVAASHLDDSVCCNSTWYCSSCEFSFGLVRLLGWIYLVCCSREKQKTEK